MKYYCYDCKGIFDREELDEETNIFGITGFICPVCKSGDVGECDKCEICGEYVAPKTSFCKDCADNIRTTWDNTVVAFAKEHKITYEKSEEFILDWIERELC